MYELHIGEDGVPLNSDSEIVLEGVLCVGYARVLELRKLNGKKRVPRLSVRASSASLCSAVVLPLVEVSPGRWVADCEKATPVLVPLLSLGRRVAATAGSGVAAGTLSLGEPAVAAGGRALRAVALSTELFEATAMQAVEKDLMAMKVTELKEELAAREEPISGNKAWLRRRLHAAIVRDHLEARDAEGA